MSMDWALDWGNLTLRDWGDKELAEERLKRNSSSGRTKKPIEKNFQVKRKIWLINSYLVSFKIDWFDLPAVQGTLKNLLQHRSLKASILRHSAFFIVELSHPHPYMATRNTIDLTRQTFVGEVMSLLFNMLSRLVTTSSKEQAYFNFMAAVTIYINFGTPKNKSLTVSTVSPSICHKVMGPDAMILVFWMLSFKPTFSLFFSLSSRGSLVLRFLP